MFTRLISCALYVYVDVVHVMCFVYKYTVFSRSPGKRKKATEQRGARTQGYKSVNRAISSCGNAVG